MKAKAPRIGRPPLPKKLAKGALLSVRFSADERRALDRAAKARGIALSKWARGILLAEAAEKVQSQRASQSKEAAKLEAE